MAGKSSPHRLEKINTSDRTAFCKTCGPVGIKSAGSNGHGGKRWRCAAQVIRYKRSKAELDRERERQDRDSLWQRRYALDVQLPCCQTCEHIDAPHSDERDWQGDLRQDWVARCSACGSHYCIEVIISDEKTADRTDVVFYVKYVIAEQAYVNGRLDGGTQTAQESYDAAEAARREEQDSLASASGSAGRRPRLLLTHSLAPDCGGGKLAACAIQSR